MWKENVTPGVVTGRILKNQFSVLFAFLSPLKRLTVIVLRLFV
jgi:hypothetical protein